MKIGIFNTASNRIEADPRVALENFVSLALEAERLGYWSIWTTEHHFGSDPGYRPFGISEDEYPGTDYDVTPDPLVLLAHVAAKTSTLRLGTGVVVPHWDHPLRLVERAALVDTLSGGRLELGVGRGNGYREAVVFGVPVDPEPNLEKYQEAVELMRKAWSGEEFTWEGKYFQLPPLRLTPRPMRQPAPFWVGSVSHSSAVWAAELGLPYVTTTWPLTELSQYVKKKNVFDETIVANGGDPSDFHNPVQLFFHCAETDAEAEDVCYRQMMQLQYVVEQHYELTREHAENAVVAAGVDAYVDLEALARFPIEHHIVGSPETCAERIDWFEREVGMNYLLGIVGMGNMPAELTQKSIRLFGEKVLPQFADRRDDAVPAG